MMATEITMPQLGESVTEGTISKWLVSPGDKVNKYDPIAEVMTDKVNAEIPSSYTGVIKELVVGEDETVEVGKVICLMEVEGQEQQQKGPENTSPKEQVQQEQQDDSAKMRYSPAVLKLSQEHNINLSQVHGSGKGGRITRKDILAIVEKGGQQPSPAPTPAKVEEPQTTTTEVKVDRKSTAQAQPVYTQQAGDIEIPVSGVRKAIAENLVRSKHEAPHAWMMVEVDVTKLVQYRNEQKAKFKATEGITLTFLPFFIKATVEALKEFPQINAMWAGDKIIQKKDVNISIAVATDDALFVPVIKQADQKSITGLATDIHNLAQKVRTGKMTSAEMQGGTFTVNNTGSFGSVLSTPIINHPQAAILSIESIVKRPVIVENDMIAIRSMVNLCLSLDHRVLDGLICGRFLARIKEKLEGFSPEHTSLY
ncbi:dihydrolipoamide acetyltransferase family protein [Alkalihalobacterium bogoriense]|uniref:dihydrolipoamide acetyltransferase family protein n=1 Tax=Alkalihalobacterium bogoriense TaxID=246272 RepID=UPI00047DB3B1|nr:dihydrolipoamide acetyltransferase family protein [Alkalihalobacterium bogoriense]